MINAQKDASPSPATEVPQLDQAAVTSHRYAALRKVHAAALKATLAANSYENFASCFPTSATYCPRALEGVWKQLNTRLEEECTKDFEKICQERDIARGLATWEELVEEAKARKAQAQGELDTDTKPPHLLSAAELHSTHLAPILVTAEKELKNNLHKQQEENQELYVQVEQQKAELAALISQLESQIADVDNAAAAIEQDEMRHETLVTLQSQQLQPR